MSALTLEAAAAAVPDVEARRLLWRCRRGMKELDVLLERAVPRLLADASPAERERIAQLLALADPLLAGYLLGDATPPDPHLAQLVGRIHSLCRLGPSREAFPP
jgi:antitoxin CptB